MSVVFVTGDMSEKGVHAVQAGKET